jgi:CRISPR-associated endonuclease Cas1
VAAANRIHVASGFGLKVFVDRGHLVVHDGIGRKRRTVRFNRATCQLRRLVILGHSGYVTFEALRWLRDIGAAFVHIDRDGTLVTVTAAERLHESRLRRAQVLAAENDIGRRTVIGLLQLKLERQADLAERRLSILKSSIVRDRKLRISIGDAIREQAEAMRPGQTWAELRKLESIAGRYYWQTWARLPIRFEHKIRATVPEHWHTAGPRTSKVDRQWPRRAMTPVHAALNYAYSILEAECAIAAYAVGFDPSIGLMHADVRYRGGLAVDLMEPLRPVVDETVLNLFEQRDLGRGDVLETRQGICRVGEPLARELAEQTSSLRPQVAVIVEDTAAAVSRSSVSTPLTRRKHRAAVAKTAKARSATNG